MIIGFLLEAEASYHLLRSKFGGMSAPDAKQLKELETDNSRLRKLPSERMFESDVINGPLR